MKDDIVEEYSRVLSVQLRQLFSLFYLSDTFKAVIVLDDALKVPST